MAPTSEAKDYAYWEGEFDKRRREQLQTVRTAATNWSKTLAGLLGLFGTVTFAGGLTTIDKLPKDRNLALIPADTLVGDIKVLVVVAFALSAVAFALTTLAAGEIFPSTRKADSPTKLRDRSITGAGRALGLLRVGQGFGAAAAVVVLAGSLVMFLTPGKDSSSDPPTVIAVTSAGVFCGKLEGTPEALTVAGQALTRGSGITVVDACPGS